MLVHFAAVILTAIVIGSSISTASRLHSASLRSIQSSTAECDLYLPTSSLRRDCGPRCVALVNRIWNDTVGSLSETIGRFYTPGSQTPCALNRTRQCLSQVIRSTPAASKCQLADASVNCYISNYGQLDTSTPFYVPYTDVQQVRILTECAAMLGVLDKLPQMTHDGFMSIPEGACLLRCLLIRQDLYNDQTGPDLRRISLQCGGYGDYEQEWRANVSRCVEAVQAEGICDKCVQAERIAVECLEVNLKIYEVQLELIRSRVPLGIRFNVNALVGANANAMAKLKSYLEFTVFYYYWLA